MMETYRTIWLHVDNDYTLQWRHNGYDSVSNHMRLDCLLNLLFRSRWKKTSKLHVTGLSAGNSLVTCEFPAQSTSNAETVSIWWRHHDKFTCYHRWYILAHLNPRWYPVYVQALLYLSDTFMSLRIFGQLCSSFPFCLTNFRIDSN